MLVALPFAMYRLLHSMSQLFEFKGGAFEMDRATTEATYTMYGCIFLMFLTAGTGWWKWMRQRVAELP